jgi:iron complex transport system substrate-binding protein
LTIALAAAALTSGASSARARGADESGKAVTDEAGRRVLLPADVKRIVSLAPNLTETIYALGLGDHLAGDTNYCDTPPEAARKPHVGEPLNPSLEAIVALHPDVVLATTSINRRETVDALERLGIAVYASDPHTVLGLLDSIERLGELLGAKREGNELAGHLRSRLDALHARLEEKPVSHVLFVVWKSPLITIGQNTFIADAMRWAGAESVVLSEQNWPQLSFEEVVRLQPEYIVFANDHSGADASELANLRAEVGWKSLDAVEEGHVVVLSDEVARPSPGLVDAIEQLAHELHPEVFGAQNERPTLLFATGASVLPVARMECAACAR